MKLLKHAQSIAQMSYLAATVSMTKAAKQAVKFTLMMESKKDAGKHLNQAPKTINHLIKTCTL
jgi:hypothetical protein